MKLIIGSLVLALLMHSAADAQSTFGGNAQHTANYAPAAQNLNSVHWTASIDLNNTGSFAHYGAPLITPANTVFVPVKTGSTGGFRIDVFNGTGGATLYSLSTDYVQPSHNWILPYQPVLATSAAGTRLYYPGAGGTVYYIDNVDGAGHGAPVQQVFYGLAAYQANQNGFNSTVFIDTPLTADSSGNVFFGFRVAGTAPAPLSTTQSGFARIDPNGNAVYVLAGTISADANITRDTHNSAPALSNDESTLYVAVKSGSTETYGYLLGLNASTLSLKYKVFLKDPRNSNANNATLLDDSTASPMVGPDGDVYFGIFGNPANGSRGFLLHFSGDLATEKAPGGFGWDNTASIVPASMVPSYTGTSSYLLFTKYNNYANSGNDSGDGVNRIALLDPNATQVDAHASSNGMLIMREVLTVIGPTPDPENRSASLPRAVREWCINTAAINPATQSIFAPSEDGHIYRWNLATNSLDQFLALNPGVGEPYVPTVIGPDGQIYTLNGGTMSVLGSLNGVGVALTSSISDIRNGVAGQSVTFTVTVTNPGAPSPTPTGTVTLQDTVYFVPSPNVLNHTTTTLASNVPLVNGVASFTTSALTADQHFITASYSGDGTFNAGNAALVQFVHTAGSATALASTPNPSQPNQSVTFTATVTAVPPGSGTPSGQVTFKDGSTVIAQLPVNGSGVAAFSTTSLSTGSHSVTATYASDSILAASSGGTTQSVQTVNATSTSVSSTPNPSVSGQSVTFTSTTISGAGSPVGAVTFKEGTTVLASNVNAPSGQASFSTTTLTPGSHTITATFTGAAGWGNSSGNAAPQVVTNPGATTTAVSSSLNPSVYSQSVTFTAAVTSGGGGTPTGTVTFKNGSATLGTGALSSGIATFSSSTLPTGALSITAVYGGGGGLNASTSPVLTQTVAAETTSTTLTSSVNPAARKQALTFTATVTFVSPGTVKPTGTVTFKDGNKTLGTGTLSGGKATLTTSTLAKGAHQVTAVYGGGSNFQTSTSAVLTQNVN